MYDYYLPLCLHTCLCPQQGGGPCPDRGDGACIKETLEHILVFVIANTFLCCCQDDSVGEDWVGKDAASAAGLHAA